MVRNLTRLASHSRKANENDVSVLGEEDRGLLPIMSPLFNIREICKQIVLLEDHLNNVRKRCPDCIRKHFLTIEAFFEEAISLDRDLKYLDILEGQAQTIRDLQYFWLNFKDDAEKSKKGYYEIAQFLRDIRKELTPFCFDVVDIENSKFNVKTASTMTCPHRVVSLWYGNNRFATKSQSEEEDAQVQNLVHKEPKKKPPRKDLRKNRVTEKDPDLEDLSGDGDRDLSLHNTKVAYRYFFNRK